MYKPQRKSLYIIIGFLVGITAILITYIAFYNMPSMVKEIRKLKTEVKVLEETLDNQNFDLNTLSMTNQSLRLDIADRDLQIIELKVKEEMYFLSKEMLEYCIVYIHVLQIKMAQSGLDYEAFILESVARDDFWEDFEEQESYFEKAEGIEG